MSISNPLLIFGPHNSVKIRILLQIIHINHYFMLSNQYNSYIGILDILLYILY